MKKMLAIGMSVAMVLAFAMTAAAEVDVLGTVNMTKDISVSEITLSESSSLVQTQVIAEPAGAAAANIMVNQKNDTVVLGNAAIAIDTNATDTITDSIEWESGIRGVNQAAGSLNNQGNVVAMGITDSHSTLAQAQADVGQKNIANNLTIQGAFLSGILKDKIEDALTDNSGIIGVNQAAGYLNNQTNAVALAAGVGPAIVAMADASLGQVNSGNLLVEFGVTKTATIQNALKNNQGIVGVNQAPGSLNNQANIVALSFGSLVR